VAYSSGLYLQGNSLEGSRFIIQGSGHMKASSA